MLKREWGAESNGKLPHLPISNKTAAWVSEFAVEDLPLSRTAVLVPEFAVKDLPLGRILIMICNLHVVQVAQAARSLATDSTAEFDPG